MTRAYPGHSHSAEADETVRSEPVWIDGSVRFHPGNVNQLICTCVNDAVLERAANCDKL